MNESITNLQCKYELTFSQTHTHKSLQIRKYLICLVLMGVIDLSCNGHKTTRGLIEISTNFHLLHVTCCMCTLHTCMCVSKGSFFSITNIKHDKSEVFGSNK